MGTQELYLLSPELLIGCFALFIIILGTIFKFTKITYLIAIIGTVASLCTSIYLLLTSESQIILYNSYSLDDFSLFLKTLIFASLLVVLIMSISIYLPFILLCPRFILTGFFCRTNYYLYFNRTCHHPIISSCRISYK